MNTSIFITCLVFFFLIGLLGAWVGCKISEKKIKERIAENLPETANKKILYQYFVSQLSKMHEVHILDFFKYKVETNQDIELLYSEYIKYSVDTGFYWWWHYSTFAEFMQWEHSKTFVDQINSVLCLKGIDKKHLI